MRIYKLPDWPSIEAQLGNLNQGNSKGKPALHKPILLLAIIDGFDNGEFIFNEIRITPELVARFENYSRHVGGNFSSRFYQPFFHLQSCGFWHLKLIPGRAIETTAKNSISGIRTLTENVEYGYFSSSFFEFILNPKQRFKVREFLINRYFTEAYIKPIHDYVFDAFHERVVDEPGRKYKTIISKEIDKLVRSAVFQKTVPKLYEYSCCISGMKIISSNNCRMVDACHIKPLSQNGTDHVTNGISLCPNLHRAFDQFLISINTDYKVVVSNSVIDNSTPYSISNFESKPIKLPQDPQFHPAIINLSWHYAEFLRRQRI